MVSLKFLFAFLLVLPASVLGRNSASLICENGDIDTERRGGDIVACYTPVGSNCGFENLAYDGWWPSWSGFKSTRVTNIWCNGAADAALCYRSGNNLYVSDRCSGNGFEAVATIVSDGQSRRRLGQGNNGNGNGNGKDKGIDFKGKDTMEAVIDGKEYVLINPDW